MTVAASEGREAVLVVDDDEDVRASVSRFLRARGYEVVEARDCRTALEVMAPPAGGQPRAGGSPAAGGPGRPTR